MFVQQCSGPLNGAGTKSHTQEHEKTIMNGEEIKVIDGVAYLHTPHGFGTCKMAEKFDKWIGVTNTARNWNSVLKLAELGRVAQGSL